MKNEDDKIMVSIWCTAYNHEKYIRQCLDGFVNQKTDFEFEVIIHEDASTDSTASIIREYEQKYSNIIKPIYQTVNQYSQKHINMINTFFLPKAKGKYIAMCEGDDYWTDPLKLQKQVDFLESHVDYGLVHTLANVYVDNQHLYRKNSIGENFDNVEKLIVANRIVSLTTCYRSELLDYYKKEIKPDKLWSMGDYPLWIYIALKSKVYFLNEVTGVYRILENSASHNPNINKEIDFLYSSYFISRFFAMYSNKKHLLHKIREIFLNNILRLYIIRNQKSDRILWSIVKKEKVFSLKSFFLFFFVNSKIGRNYLKTKWEQ